MVALAGCVLRIYGGHISAFFFFFAIATVADYHFMGIQDGDS